MRKHLVSPDMFSLLSTARLLLALLFISRARNMVALQTLSGVYTIPSFPPGRHDIEVTYVGMFTIDTVMNFQPGVADTVNFYLRRNPAVHVDTIVTHYR
jgi:hypothetical protein